MRLLSALLLALAGWLVGRLVQSLLTRLMGGLFQLLGRRFPSAAIGTSRVHKATIYLLPRIVFWFVLLVFLALATELLGLPVFSAWMSKVLDFIPTILTAVLLVLAGVWGGTILKQTISRTAAVARLPYARLLGGLCQTAVVAGASVIAVNQLGIDLSFLMLLTGIIVGALLLSVTLAFGLGAQMMASNIISCHYLRSLYRVGNMVEIGGIKGTIIQITRGVSRAPTASPSDFAASILPRSAARSMAVWYVRL